MFEEQEVKDQQEGQEQGQTKEEKAFNQGLEKLVALLNGDQSARKKVKIKNDRVSILVAKINEKRTQGKEEEFVNRGVELLDNWAKFDIQCAEEERKFKSAIAAKKKEFLTQMLDLFALLESIDKLNGQYQASLKKILPEQAK